MQPQRRSYSKPFKAQVIQECSQSGAAIANVALSHNLKLAGFLATAICRASIAPLMAGFTSMPALPSWTNWRQ
jgi:transposase-like protein